MEIALIVPLYPKLGCWTHENSKARVQSFRRPVSFPSSCHTELFSIASRQPDGRGLIAVTSREERGGIHIPHLSSANLRAPVEPQNLLRMVGPAFLQHCQTLNMKLGNANKEEQTCRQAPWSTSASPPPAPRAKWDNPCTTSHRSDTSQALSHKP